MKSLILAATLLLPAHGVLFGLGANEFHIDYWFADGVAVGRVVAVRDGTVHFEIREWVRDRTEQREVTIRSYRFSPWAGCIPGAEKPAEYALGEDYLLFMRQPYDDGGAQVPDWSILAQFLLDGSPVCITQAPSVVVEKGRKGCKDLVRDDDLLNAVRTFENCFELYDDPIRGTLPIRQTCNPAGLESWSKRSVLHRVMAEKAVEQLRKEKSGGV
jgi:hypothetical protein